MCYLSAQLVEQCLRMRDAAKRAVNAAASGLHACLAQEKVLLAPKN